MRRKAVAAIYAHIRLDGDQLENMIVDKDADGHIRRQMNAHFHALSRHRSILVFF